MLRRRALRQFSSLSRSQFRFPHQPPRKVPNGAPIKFYEVRFTGPPFFTWKRARRILLYSLTFAAVWRYVVPEFITISFEEVEEGAVGEDGQPAVDGEEGKEVEVEDGLFIPVGWPQQQSRTYYKGSDPEWQEFIKFAKDPKRHKDAQTRLVSAIRDEVAGLPNSKRILGEVNMKKGRHWLEVIFPDGPPQDYEVSGIEITEEFVAWSIKTVSQKEYQRLTRTMFPIATAKASWASIRYQLDTQKNKVREYFGLEPTFDPEVAFIKAHLKDRSEGSDATQSGGGPAASRPALDSPPKIPDGTFTPVMPGSSKAESQEDEGETKVGFPKLPSLVPRGESKPITFALFLSNLKKNRGPTAIEPPRGSLVITGLIEVIGTKGRTTLDVSAAFDPPTNEFVIWSWKPRRIQPKHQRPRGGP